MDTKVMMAHLAELKENNTREWYRQHKAQRMAVAASFEELVAALELEIMAFDPAYSFHPTAELTFKQVRDVRFSNDKTPYNPSLRAHIGPKGKSPIPVGYYVKLAPDGDSFIGAGLFTDIFKDATHLIRQYIAGHEEEFLTIITEETFTKEFQVLGTRLKRVPKPYDPELVTADHLKNKSWYLEKAIPEEIIGDAEALIKYMVEQFKKMKDFNDFLNEALITFELPKR